MSKEETVNVMRHPKLDSLFRRTLDDGTVMVFEPRIPVIVTGTQFEPLREDIGHAIVIVDIDDKDRPIVDWETTIAVRDDLFDESDEQGADPIDPKIVDLVDAGIELELAEKLADNVGHPKGGDWLLNPEAIKAKIAEGYDLSKLKGIGEVSATKIKESLGVSAE